MTVNVSEYGVALNFNANYDLSGSTNLLLSFIRPDGTLFTGAPTVPTTDLVTTDQGTFTAKKYARYLFKDGDLTRPGEYTVRLIYMDASPKRLVSDVTSFMVYP